MSLSCRRLAGGTLALCVFLCGCDSDRRTSTNRPPTGPSPGAPSSIVGVEVEAPDRIAPGESVQLTARLVRSDGSRENITGQAHWNASDSRVLEVSAQGIATAKAPGETSISASHQGRTATSHVFVLPTGTFRLEGRVTERGLDFGIAGVTVTIIAGIGEGLRAVTDGDGHFRLYGVSGSVRLHAKKEGYLNRIEDLDVVDDRSLGLEMAAERSFDGLTGTYRLTLEAGSCSSGFGVLPENARRRSYTALVRQDGSRLFVRLSGADFILTEGHGNGFEGSADGNRSATFRLEYGNYYYYYYSLSRFDVVERYGSMQALMVAGTAITQQTAEGISGTLSGTFQVVNGTAAPFTSIAASCFSNSHRFEMHRQ